MWIRDIDSGKWFKQSDTITKDDFESLKVDLQRVKLYSKCLSGATYLTISDFDNLYPQLQQSHKGYFLTLQNFRGPSIEITNNNQEEFYEKYLKESGFTLKTLFTPEKLLNDQSQNLKFVDVATTESIIFEPNNTIVIDGIRLIKGHRLLVKDQKSFITLSGIDEDDYFTNQLPVSSYTHSVFETVTKTYEYYNKTNGVYLYDGYNLVKTDELNSYDGTYKLILSTKLGEQNSGKEFHLERLKNGYYPVEGQSIEFKERNSWVLRSRVDYNNVFDLNYYDIKYFPAEKIYDRITTKSYELPERVIAIGEFGIILNNQDKLSTSDTHKISNIISNKFKVNLRSISSNNNYYWICGDEGTLIKVSKIDFSVEQIDLGEDLNFTSVSFYSDLYGMVVGKFNTIYYTRDGGFNWYKIQYDEFGNYSYNKVLHLNENTVYIVGESGVFIDMVFSNDIWLGYLRDVTKELSDIDYYPLVEDINDIQSCTFVNIQTTTFSRFTNVNSILENSLVYKYRLDSLNQLEISVDSNIFQSPSFNINDFKFYIGISYSTYNYSYISFGYDDQLESGDIRKGSLISASFLPTIDGNIDEGKIDVTLKVIHNYNYLDPVVMLDQLTYSYVSFSINPKKGNLLLMTGNNETVICHDVKNIIDQSKNQFIFLNFDQSIGDGMSISKKQNSDKVFLGGDKVYMFNIGDFNNVTDISTNSAFSITLQEIDNLFVNKINTYNDTVYVAGNNSVLKFSENNNLFKDLDPTFVNRLDSRFLVLDYDIGSKLNFFDDNGQYRLPKKLEIPIESITQPNTIFSLTSQLNEVSWIDYFSDSEKTFAYNTHMEDSNVVKYSNSFVYDPFSSDLILSNVGIGADNFNYGLNSMAPHFSDPTNSEYVFTENITTFFTTGFDILIHKNLMIIKNSYLTKINGRGQVDYQNLSDKTQVGDVLLFKSDIVETKLLVNKVLYFTSNSTTGLGTYVSTKPLSMASFDRLDAYLYCYCDFNENIINYLKKNINVNKPIYISNLNRYSGIDGLINNFNLHPYGFGYKLSKTEAYLNFEGLFNDKTAYYNLQCYVSDSRVNYNFNYKQSFLDFGFTPTYNIFSFLNKINSEIFLPQKDFKILPKYFDLIGNDLNSATDDNVYIDSNNQSNYLRFGKNYYLQWRSLLINTFLDIKMKTQFGDFIFNQFLIVEKYYDTSLDSYFIRFNKKLTLQKGYGVRRFDIFSRNTLEEISKDLQLLNNIHRSPTPKSIKWQSGNGTVEKTFTNYESSIKTKFSTESYLYAFVSDYDIRQTISAILYNDSNFEVSMNVLNLEKQSTFQIAQIDPDLNNFVSFIVFGTQDEIKVGDLIFLELNSVNSTIEGYQTVTFVNSNYIKTSKPYDFNANYNSGQIKVIKQDPFFNFQPVDIFKTGADKSVSRSIEVLPKNTKLAEYNYSLINLNFFKYKIELIDGLSLLDLSRKYHWILEAEISNALIGEDKNGLIWYSGTWKCGRWFGGTWHQGRWLSGDWYDGVWNAYNVLNNIISAEVDESFSDETLSIWYNGRWFKGTWNNGIWYNGRRYAGDWLSGTWNNGIWNDGEWKSGTFRGGIWVLGNWERGTFNCDNKPSYWINGNFKRGDFENGMWYNGVFGNEQNILTRFGTRSNNSRTSTWHAGKWIDGEFHSYLNLDGNTSNPTVSDIHKFSVWRTGIWNRGNWYGGIAYNIDFRGGIWHGGILEEIQVVGVDKITKPSTNKIYLNGIFKFNPGDEIWLIDDDRNTSFSPLGNNTLPRKYRINQVVEDDVKKQTEVFLNYDLSTLGVDPNFADYDYYDIDIGLRVVSYFKDVEWRSGLWTNGIFDGRKFDSGIWFNGLFEGVWGI